MFRATSRNLTLTALAVALTIGLFLSPAALAQPASAEQQQEAARQNEARRRAEQDQLDRVRRLKERFLSQLQETTVALPKLAADNEAFTKQITELLTSDDGKRIAQDPINFPVFLDLYEHPIATAAEINVRQKAVASILEGVKAEMKLIDVGYVPSPETHQEATSLYLWTNEHAARLVVAQAAIKTALQQAPKIAEPAKAPTLTQAIEQYRAKKLQSIADLRLKGEQAAEKEAKQIVIDAAFAAKLEQAQAERDRIKAQSDTLIAQMKALELELLQVKAEAEKKQFAAEKTYADAQAQIERLKKDAATSRAAQDTEADIARNKVVDDTKRKEQIALMKSKEVQELLAPFFAKGFWLPGTGPGSRTSQPMSLSELSAYGALKPDTSGLGRLLTVGTSTRDKDRPRWSYGHPLDRLTASDREKLVKAQNYLIEMGELMVQEGLLAK